MIEISICIIPNLETSKQSIRLSQASGQEKPTLFVLDEHKFIPHISLYHLGVPGENLSKVKKAIKEISILIKPFKIRLNSLIGDGNYVSWEIDEKDRLIDLQMLLVEKINPFREGLQRKGLQEYQKIHGANSNKYKYISKYGYPLIKDQYHPHITITKCESIQNTNYLVSSLKTNEHSFLVDGISLGEIGPHGTLPGIISTYKIK